MLQTLGTNQDRLTELPSDIHNQSINFLKEIIGYKAKEEFMRLHSGDSCGWMPERVIKEIKNLLLEAICSDEDLPSGNWRDYIYPLVDEVMGFN